MAEIKSPKTPPPMAAAGLLGPELVLPVFTIHPNSRDGSHSNRPRPQTDPLSPFRQKLARSLLSSCPTLSLLLQILGPKIG